MTSYLFSRTREFLSCKALLTFTLAFVLFMFPDPLHAKPSSNQHPAAPSAPFIQFNEVVLISLGDSLTQGTMNAVNNATNAQNSYIQKVADALGAAVGLTFKQPLLDNDEHRINPFVVPTNLGVDGADTFSLEGKEYYKRAGALDSYYTTFHFCDKLFPWKFEDLYDHVLYPINLLARRPVSQLDASIWLLNRVVERSDQTKAAVVLWIGNNESSNAALGFGAMNPTFFPMPLDQVEPELDPLLTFLLHYANSRDILSLKPYTASAINRNLTDVDDFEEQYNYILTRLGREVPGLEEHAEIFLCTLPYYSSVGFLLDSCDLEYYLQKINPSYSVPEIFKPANPSGASREGDHTSLITFLFMFFLLHQGYTVDYVNQVLADDGLVLSEDEQWSVQTRIDTFNQIIREASDSHGPNIHLIETGDYLNDVLTGRTSITINSRVLHPRWLRGGLFSMDGVHPGYTANVFIANFILERMDEVLGTKSPRYDPGEVMGKDPYIDQDGDGWVPGPDYDARGFAELLFLLRDPDDRDASVEPALPPDIWTRISDALLETLF